MVSLGVTNNFSYLNKKLIIIFTDDIRTDSLFHFIFVPNTNSDGKVSGVIGHYKFKI